MPKKITILNCGDSSYLIYRNRTEVGVVFKKNKRWSFSPSKDVKNYGRHLTRKAAVEKLVKKTKHYKKYTPAYGERSYL